MQNNNPEIQKQILDIISNLKIHSDQKYLSGMSRFGISTDNALGINIPKLRKLAQIYKKVNNRHELALELWKTKLHEAQLLAIFIDDPKLITEDQIENWVNDFNSWDICDQACKLFSSTKFAYKKCFEWADSEKEYVKRASFSLMAMLAVHDKKSENNAFIEFFPIIYRDSTDSRNMVKKAVNWALRQIGKRNIELNKSAIEISKEINKINNKTSKWISNDALRELQNPKIQQRLFKNSKLNSKTLAI